MKIKRQSNNIINEVINEENNNVQKHAISTHIHINSKDYSQMNLVDISKSSSKANFDVDTIKHQTMLTSKDSISSPIKKDHISSVFEESPSRLPQQEMENNPKKLA